MWIAIAIIFLTIVAAFLLGIYLIFRAASKKLSKVPEQVVKEVFSIVKDKLAKPKEESKELTLPPMSYSEWETIRNKSHQDVIELVNKEIGETKKLSDNT